MVQAELQLAIALSRHLEKRLQLIEAPGIWCDTFGFNGMNRFNPNFSNLMLVQPTCFQIVFILTVFKCTNRDGNVNVF